MDKGDFAEVGVPHADVAAAGVERIAVAAGTGAGFVEWGHDVSGGDPVGGAAGGSDGAGGVDGTDPAATAVVTAEEPGVIAIIRAVGIALDHADERGLAEELAKAAGKVGEHFGGGGDELWGGFGGV